MATAAHPHYEVAPQRWHLVRAMLALQIAALIAMYISGHWDAAEHAKGAVDRLWYPPHYGIYFAILAAVLLSLAGLAVLLWRTPYTPFTALKHNAPLTLVVLANALSFTGAPADALWHEIFGLDLTVWSPPHLHLLAGQVLSALGCIVYFLDDDVDEAIKPLFGMGIQFLRSARTLMVIVTFVSALLLAAFIFLEYEAGIRSRDVLARPRWAYPLLWPLFVTTTFGLVLGSTRRVGMVTLVALLYDAGRLGALVFDRTILDYKGIVGYPLIVPALVYDLAIWADLRLAHVSHARGRYRAGGLATVTLVCSTPLFWSWLKIAPELTVTPWALYWPVGLISGIVSSAVGWTAGSVLRRLRPQQAPRPDVMALVPVTSPE